MKIGTLNKTALTLSGIVGFFLALSPILDPYIIFSIGSGFTIRVNDVFMLLLGLLCFCKYAASRSKNNILLYLLMGLLLITICANIYSSTKLASSLKLILIWLVYGFVLSYIWETPCRDKFFYWLEKIAIVISVVVFLQFVAGYTGISMWDGKIPFLSLSKYDGWAGYIDINTGDIRPNGILQEASYVGIYLSVALAQALKENKMKLVAVYCAAMFATTSLVSVVSGVFVVFYSLLAAKKLKISRKMKRNIIVAAIIAVLVMIYLINTNESIGASFAYIMKRFNRMEADLTGDRMSSAKYRLLGYIDLFPQYSFVQKMIGVGVGQFSVLFDVKAYSNVWVTTLLNSGIIGLLFLIFILILLKKKTLLQNSVFFWVMILIFSSDYQWFNWYFFYLMSACVLKPSYESNAKLRG